MCVVVTIIFNVTTNGHGRGGVVDFHTEIEFYDIFYDIFKYNYTDSELAPVSGKDFWITTLHLPPPSWRMPQMSSFTMEVQCCQFGVNSIEVLTAQTSRPGKCDCAERSKLFL